MSQAIKQFFVRLLLIVVACLLNNTAVFAQGCPPGASWCSGTYVYDGMGNIRAIGADTYVYDTAGRLVSGTADVNRTGIVSRQDYSYDAFGNRISASRAAGSVDCLGGCEQSPAIDGATNHIISNGAIYDAAGNLIAIQNTVNGVTYSSTYVYDAAGSMVRATAGSDDRQFIYTADDERIATRNGQNWTWTVRDLDNKVLREFTSVEPNGQPGLPTSSRQWAKDYIWRDGLLLASVTPTTPGANTTVTEHFHLDHLGTPRLVSNDAGIRIGIHAYYPFGAELNVSPNEQPAESMKFTGHERDLLASNPNTLDYMHARYYNPSVGRFLEVDKGKPSPKQPQSWNRYAYVMNNPMNSSDPSGNCSKPSGVNRDTVGICVEGFIAAAKLNGVGNGDNRTFAANDATKTNREQVQILVNTKTGAITASTRAAVSTASIGPVVLASGQGTASTTLSNAVRQTDGTITFSAQTTAMNGLASLPGAPKDSIDYKFNFVVTPAGKVGLTPGGRTDGFPSIGAYAYQPNGATVRLYEHSEHKAEDLAPPMEVSIPAVPPE